MFSLYKRFFTYFLQGLLALLPLMVSWYVVSVLFKFVHSVFDDVLFFIPQVFRSSWVTVFLLELFIAVQFVVLVAGFGFLVKTLLGKSILSRIDRFFSSIPVLNSIYSATRQVVNLFAIRKGNVFSRPVLVEYPTPGVWAVAFNTGELVEGCNDENSFCTVFIPTSPNPTSGFTVIVPSKKIRPLNVSVEEAVKMVLTGGAVKMDNLGVCCLRSLQVKNMLAA
ncbi:MAG: DUF502 domain-containing protein [Chitinispirillaceae bacterium]